jgi:hypothetical protein
VPSEAYNADEMNAALFACQTRLNYCPRNKYATVVATPENYFSTAKRRECVNQPSQNQIPEVKSNAEMRDCTKNALARNADQCGATGKSGVGFQFQALNIRCGI